MLRLKFISSSPPVVSSRSRSLKKIWYFRRLSSSPAIGGWSMEKILGGQWAPVTHVSSLGSITFTLQKWDSCPLSPVGSPCCNCVKKLLEIQNTDLSFAVLCTANLGRTLHIVRVSYSRSFPRQAGMKKNQRPLLVHNWKFKIWNCRSLCSVRPIQAEHSTLCVCHILADFQGKKA